MSSLIRLHALLLAVVATLVAAPAAAQNLLTSGDFEATVGGGEVPDWTLEEFRTGDPGNTDVNAAELVGFADNPGGGSGLWLRAFVGNPDDGTAEAILSQTVSATPGETYNLVADALFEGNYAGGVVLLDPLSPFGEIPSPTDTLLQLDFLDGGGNVLDTATKDIATEIFNGLGYVTLNPLSAVAPVGTTDVRVSGIGSGLAFNVDPGQSAFLDNFSLTTSSAPGDELLANGDLNNGPPSVEDLLAESFEFIETPDTENTLSIAGFANDPATGGSNGVWIRPFIDAGTGAIVKQTVEGSAGTEYSFSASARWEENFLGADLSGDNEVLIEVAFLDEGDQVISSEVLDLRSDGKTADNEWSTHTVSGVAPEGTVSVSVAGIVNMLTNNADNPGAQSAFWDDFVLTAGGGLMADFNGDGTVDLLDLDILGQNFGGPGPAGDANGDGAVDLLDLDILGQEFGSGGASAVPEPSALLIASLGLALGACRRTRS